MTWRGPRYNSTSTPSRTAVLGCSSPASKTEMFDDEAVARNAHRRPQRQIPQGLASGRVHMTAGINAKGSEFVGKALVRVMAFDDFTADNDPHGEHDFGSFELEGEKVFWKIDYYDLAGEFGSEDPADPKKTLRVLPTYPCTWHPDAEPGRDARARAARRRCLTAAAGCTGANRPARQRAIRTH